MNDAICRPEWRAVRRRGRLRRFLNQKGRAMRYVTRFLLLAAVLMAVAACSSTGDPQVPIINGVPVDGAVY
jgi:hypothetical protein